MIVLRFSISIFSTSPSKREVNEQTENETAKYFVSICNYLCE